MKDSIRIFPDAVCSFAGDTVAIKLIADRDISKENIIWSASSDALSIKSFADDTRYAFTDGVILTLLKAGEATVTARFDGRDYSIPVSIREMRHTESGADLNYYIGDLHDHTSHIHDPKLFPLRGDDRAAPYIEQVKNEGKMDLTVITDHGELLTPNEFLDNFFTADGASPELVALAGCESAVSVMETDRYGITTKQSGEIVTLNTDDFTDSSTWEEFYSRVASKPFTFCTLAHPQIIGYSHKGMWNFSLNKNNSPEMRHAIRGVEMGNGSTRESNLINELVYSIALDNGFKVSATCSSDSHGPEWGYGCFPGKTVIMAKSKSKEDFLDALLSNRFYATESGNVRLSYSVNGAVAPATLAPCSEYSFSVSISLFREDIDSTPTECRVISNRGLTVKTVTGDALSELSFTVKAEDADYFYLRLTDKKSRKTWSAPVFVDREKRVRSAESIKPIDKSGFTVTDARYGSDASALVCDDPNRFWHSEHSDAEIVIDMGRTEKIKALGHYPRVITREILAKLSKQPSALICELPVEYTLETSLDGRAYTVCDEGLFRAFGGEEIIPFDEVTARYVRLTVHSNVAEYSGHASAFKKGLAIGELTLYR